MYPCCNEVCDDGEGGGDHDNASHRVAGHARERVVTNRARETIGEWNCSKGRGGQVGSFREEIGDNCFICIFLVDWWWEDDDDDDDDDGDIDYDD